MSSDISDAGGDELASVSDDAEEMIDKARLRSLFEARDEAAEAIRESSIREVEISRRYEDADAKTVIDEHVRQAVLAYVLEAEPLLQNTAAGQDLWEDAGLAPVALPDRPAVDWDGVPSRKVKGVPTGWVDESRGVIHVPGIGHFVSLETPFTVRWQGFAAGAGLGRGNDHAERSAQMTLPRGTSEDVFRSLNRLLADLGIGIQAELDEDDEAHVDYSDLI